MRVTTLLAAVCAAAVFFLSTVLPAAAAPALWLVQSPAGKIYLFGTVHLLRDGVPWQSPELEDAIAQSQDLYLELADPTNLAAMSAVFKVGFDRTHPLSTKISKDDVAQLDAIAKKFGYPGETSFEPMQPWLVFMMLSMMPATRSGYSASNGVDVQVRKQFVAAGKPVNGLETPDMQIHLFSDLPLAEQVALLEAELEAATKAAAPEPAASKAPATSSLDAIVDAWMSGDQDRLERTLGGEKFESSAFGDRLLAQRNKTWATLLAARLQKPGTSFVSVGAAHLVGTDGVPALLATMGFTVTRVPIAQTSSVPSANPNAAQAPAASPLPSAAPTASPTPIPQTIKPPPGWTPKSTTIHASSFQADMMFVNPKGGGAILTGHLSLPGTLNLDTAGNLMQQGFVAVAGDRSVTPGKRVKICGGKQDGVMMSATLQKVREEVVVAVSDRPYLAQYIRLGTAPEDPAAVRSILSLCAP
jgi:hypothetical protein